MCARINSYISYDNLLKDMSEFKKSGTNNGNLLNLFDFPSHKYFKILFYFGSVDEKLTRYGTAGHSHGLLHPTWEIFNKNGSSDSLSYYDYNSAWTYLKINNEEERADLLEKFVTLLSNINSTSPWYFNKISGIDAAMERKAPVDGKLEMSEPGKLTISCLQDSFDNRIGTLLDLYRSIVWSWINKREILPANLRKFDMAIYFFESPVKSWNDTRDDSNDVFEYSYKMLEFHDCEIDYNSIKSGWGEVNNQTGFNPTYNIDISYSSCYDISFNEHVMRMMGDTLLVDAYTAIYDETGENLSYSAANVKKSKAFNQTQLLEDKILAAKNNINRHFEESHKEELQDKNLRNTRDYAEESQTYNHNEVYSYGNLQNRTSKTPITREPADVIKDNPRKKVGFLENAVGQVVGLVTDHIKEKFNRALLGNLYTYSLTQIGSQLSEAAKGNIIKAGQSVKQYVKNAQQRAAAKVKQSPSGELFDSTPRSFKGTGSSLGNLGKSSIANNL